VRASKFFQPQEHDFPGGIQRVMRILRIAARPKLAPDLEARNFAARTNRTVVVATFDHGKGGPAIHGGCGLDQP